MAESFSDSWKAFLELMDSEHPLRIPHQLIINRDSYVEDEYPSVSCSDCRREIIDTADDSPENAIGIDEDDLSVDLESQEESVVRIGGI